MIVMSQAAVSIVVPYSEQDLPYAQEAADRLAAYVWEKRHEFHYTGLTASPSKALQMALDFQDKPVFITDSGDNVTSGATGWNTGILRQVLQTETTKNFYLRPYAILPHTRHCPHVKQGRSFPLLWV